MCGLELLFFYAISRYKKVVNIGLCCYYWFLLNRFGSSGGSGGSSEHLGTILGSVFGSIIGFVVLLIGMVLCCIKCPKRSSRLENETNVADYKSRLQTVTVAPPPYNTAVPSAQQPQNTVVPSAHQPQNTAVPTAPPPYSATVFTIQPGSSHQCGYSSSDILASDRNYPSNWNSLGKQRLNPLDEKSLVHTKVVNHKTTSVKTLPSL